MPRRTAAAGRLTVAAARLAGQRGRFGAGTLVAVAAVAAVLSAESVAAGAPADAARSVTMFGARTVARSVAHEPAGRAAAFSYTAKTSGKARTVGIYVGSRARNARLRVALYSSSRHRPAVLLASGSRLRPRTHAWNVISIRPVRIVAKRHYWLVALASRGRVTLRYRRTRSCTGADRNRAELSGFPKRWRSRPAAPGCQISAYVRGSRTSGSSTPPVSGGPTPPPAPTPPTPPSPPAPQTKGCFANPSACGYPDQTNTGAPAGTAVTVKNGDQTIGTAGTYTGWNVQNGSVRINASNVTIKDFVVTNTGDTSNAILIPSGVTNVTIEDSTLSGAATNTAIQYAVQNASDGVVTGLRLDMFNCTECWSGSGTIQDSYAISNGVIAGSHYEDIYFGGGSPLTVAHDTLYNPQDQTAAIFTKGDFGPVGTVSITNNLLAGGGYTIYGGLTGSYPVNGPVTVTGNRFARSLSRSADANGYFPDGGSYAAVADFRSSVTKWSGNHWDDNLADVPEQ
jgi:hypothetical protein